MSKTYLKSDHFNGVGSMTVGLSCRPLAVTLTVQALHDNAVGGRLGPRCTDVVENGLSKMRARTRSGERICFGESASLQFHPVHARETGDLLANETARMVNSYPLDIHESEARVFLLARARVSVPWPLSTQASAGPNHPWGYPPVARPAPKLRTLSVAVCSIPDSTERR
jgi:hypothetical protein